MVKKLSPMEQKASGKVLEELRKHAQDMMKGKMANLKKVTVASDSKEGLKKGLATAEKIIEGKKPEESACPMCGEKDCQCDKEESADEEASETPEDETTEEEMTADEIDSRIKELLALKAKKQ